jgi:hypothetical protein
MTESTPPLDDLPTLPRDPDDPVFNPIPVNEFQAALSCLDSIWLGGKIWSSCS